MACVKKEKIFEFINNELPVGETQQIKQHIETCEKCRGTLEQIQAQINCIKTKLNVLNPEIIPQKAYISPNNFEAVEINYVHRHIKSKILRPGFSVKLAVVVVVLISVFWLIPFNREKTLDEIKVQNIVYAVDDYLDIDPKQFWNEKALLITIIDEQRNTVEVIASSIAQEELKSDVIDLKLLTK